jgi:hypothetical protein
MPSPDAELIETVRALSDDELVERWREGYLTDIAMKVARAEFLRRGMVVPEAGPAEEPEPLAAEAREIIGLLEAGRFAIGEDN